MVDSEIIIGHIMLDDFRSEDGILSMYSEQNIEDLLFKGQFIKIESKSKEYFCQIIDEPKFYPVAGPFGSAMVEYPILHQEKVQYIPAYKIVSRVKIWGEVANGLTLKSHFARPRPASTVKVINVEAVRRLLNVSGEEVLGVIIGYEGVEEPITLTVNNMIGSKHIGIFGMSGQGKSNTSLRMAEIFAKMGWCIIFFDYSGEYRECSDPSSDNIAFSKNWEALDITPKGNANVKVYQPIKDDRKIEGVTKFCILSKELSRGLLSSILCDTDAQRRIFFNLLSEQRLPKEKYHLDIFDKIIEDKLDQLKGRDRKIGPLEIIKERIDIFKYSGIIDSYDSSDISLDNQQTWNKFLAIPKVDIPSGLDIENIIQENTINVIDFSYDAISDMDYKLIVFIILNKLFNIKQSQPREYYPKIMVIIEEAHIPFKEIENDHLSRHVNEISRKIFKMGRKKFLNICAISQRPKDIPSAIMSQINTRIIHKLKTRDDIFNVIQGDVKDYEGIIPNLKLGEAIIDSSDLVISPLILRIAPARSKKIQ